jgi:hypothetical protein
MFPKNNNSARRLDRSNTKTSQPATNGAYEVSFPTTTEYKKISIPKCHCGTCYVLGSDVIRSIYNLQHIIEENNPLIFSFLGKALVK